MTEDLQIRRELAACYRWASHFGMSDLVSTHISARLPGAVERILINAYGLLFDEVAASNLVEVRLDGSVISPLDGCINPAGFLIHSAIHAAREDVVCVMHTHTPAGVAVSAQTAGLLPISQFAMQFYNRIGYHPYEGIALLEAERARLVADLGHHQALILQNHGLLTVGRSIGEAFTLMHNLQRACEIQLMAQSGTAELCLPPEHIRNLTAEQHADFAGEAVGAPEWRALMRRIEKIAPSYKD